MFRNRRSVAVMVLMVLAAGAVFVGCYGSEGVTVVSNLMKGKSFLKVYLDGMEAKQNTAKKAATGYSNWEVKEQVSGDNPKISYKVLNPDKVGRITATIVNVYQEFRGDYSTQAEFSVFPRDNKPENLMKENVVYDLGKPPKALKVIDVSGNEVKGVKLTPGMKYMIQITVRADKSETACVYFKAK